MTPEQVTEIIEKLTEDVKEIKSKLFEEPDPFEEPGFLRNLMPTKEDAKLAVAGIGAASSGTVAGYVQQVWKGARTDYAKILSGYVGYKLIRQPWIKSFFMGVVISGVSDIATAQGLTLAKVTGGIGASPGASSNKSTLGV